MTLARQLLALLLLLLAAAYAGQLVVNLRTTQAFLHQQLAAHAQDTATSLGVALSGPVAEGDLATARAVVDAVFDRGYYTRVQVNDAAGEPLILRRLETRIDGVPRWLIEHVPLEAPMARAPLMDGWHEAGAVLVRSHPGYAYGELWDAMRGGAVWAAVALLLAGITLGLGLRLLLRPLRRAEALALAVAERRFPRFAPMPRTRELAAVARALDTMSSRLEATFAEQGRQLEALRGEAYQDPLTGLDNGRRFELRLAEATAGGGEGIGTALLLMRVLGLDAVNARHGTGAGDALLRELARASEATLATVPGAQLGRLGGGLFGALLPAAGADGAQEARRRWLDTAEPVVGRWPGVRLRAGHAIYGGTESPEALMAAAGATLHADRSGRPPRQAQVGAVEAAESSLRHALDRGCLRLAAQDMLACDGALLGRELLVRAPGPHGALLTGGVLIAAALRAGLDERLDQAVVALALRALRPPAMGAVPCTLNVGVATLIDAGRREHLLEALRGLDEATRPPLIEVDEAAAAGHLPALEKARDALHDAGAGLVIDRFGTSPEAAGLLAALRPDLVKLDGGIGRGALASREAAAFVRVVRDLTRTLEIPLVATFVERPEERDALCALGVDGVQGQGVAPPALLE